MATLRLFASIKEAAKNRGSLELDANTVGELLDVAGKELGAEFLEQAQLCKIWLNGEPADMKTSIGADDEVALLPPVSGGQS